MLAECQWGNWNCDSCSIFASLLHYCSSPCLLWRVFKYKRCNVFTHWIYDLFWYVFTIMGRLQNIKVTIKFHRFYRSIYLCEYFFSSFYYFFSVCRMVVFVASSLSDSSVEWIVRNFQCIRQIAQQYVYNLYLVYISDMKYTPPSWQ